MKKSNTKNSMQNPIQVTIPGNIQNTTKNSDQLVQLIDELMKDQPNQSLVRKMLLVQGIPYSTDPRTQMGTVLSLMDQGLGARRVRKSESEL